RTYYVPRSFNFVQTFESMTDAQFRKSFMSQHAAVDPRTVPTVPKLLPPLPRISQTNKLHMSDVCVKWSSNSEEIMVCAASVYSDSVPRTNPFSGLYINYLYGKAECESYSQNTKKGIRHSFFQFPLFPGGCWGKRRHPVSTW
ncbi:hypothetical protein L0F63_004472, partial [Massospora cicadina]